MAEFNLRFIYMTNCKIIKLKCKDIDWDEHYAIVSSIRMFNPTVKCRYCNYEIAVEAGSLTTRIPLVRFSNDMKIHLNGHNIEQDNWMKLNNWMQDKAIAYCDESLSLKVIKVEICKKCGDEIRGNSIIFVKHLIEKHGDDIKDFPLDKLLNELHPLTSNRNEGIVEENSSSDKNSIKRKDIQEPFSNRRDILSTIQSSSKRKGSPIQTEESLAKNTKINPQDNSNNEKDDK